MNNKQKRPLYVCPFPVCTKSFYTEPELNNHIQLHTRRDIYICKYPECQREFRDESLFEQHIISHYLAREQMPFFCAVPHCNTAFQTESARYTHFINSHPGEDMVKYGITMTIESSEFLNQVNLEQAAEMINPESSSSPISPRSNSDKISFKLPDFRVTEKWMGDSRDEFVDPAEPTYDRPEGDSTAPYRFFFNSPAVNLVAMYPFVGAHVHNSMRNFFIQKYPEIVKKRMEELQDEVESESDIIDSSEEDDYAYYYPEDMGKQITTTRQHTTDVQDTKENLEKNSKRKHGKETTE